MAIKNFMGKEFSCISHAVESHIDGDTAPGTISNIQTCIGNLVEFLVDKKIATEEEVKNIILKGLFS